MLVYSSQIYQATSSLIKIGTENSVPSVKASVAEHFWYICATMLFPCWFGLVASRLLSKRVGLSSG
jgi:hypothetical protein